MTSFPFEPVSMLAYEDNFPKMVADIGEAISRYGFVVMSDHGLSKLLIDQAYAQAKAFFDLPEGEKRKYHLKNAGQRGYTPFGTEAAKDNQNVDLKEFWHMGRPLPLDHPYSVFMPENVWPEALPLFRKALESLYLAFDQLGLKILEAIASYLGLDRSFFANAVKDGNSVLRLLHYPPVTTNTDSVRAGAHADINVITLLLGAEEPGLQLQDRDGRWLDITPPENCLVVNIGDMLSRLTNQVLPSTPHRVINPVATRSGFSRYSLPFFLHFAPPFEIKTLENCISSQRPNAFPEPISAQAFLEQRLKEIRLM